MVLFGSLSNKISLMMPSQLVLKVATALRRQSWLSEPPQFFCQVALVSHFEIVAADVPSHNFGGGDRFAKSSVRAQAIEQVAARPTGLAHVVGVHLNSRIRLDVPRISRHVTFQGCISSGKRVAESCVISASRCNGFCCKRSTPHEQQQQGSEEDVEENPDFG